MIAPADNRLTPGAVQAVAFPSARIGRRGLDEDHVRAFCGLVERELVRLLSERASLTTEVERLRRLVLGQSGGTSGFGTRQDDAHVQAVRILSEAQQTAQRYVADAQEYGMRLAAEAQRRRDEMIAEARSHAQVLIEKAYGHVSTSVDALDVLTETVRTLGQAQEASRPQYAPADPPERPLSYPPGGQMV